VTLTLSALLSCQRISELPRQVLQPDCPMAIRQWLLTAGWWGEDHPEIEGWGLGKGAQHPSSVHKSCHHVIPRELAA